MKLLNTSEVDDSYVKIYKKEFSFYWTFKEFPLITIKISLDLSVSSSLKRISVIY